ncbi:hypothetical protein H3H36_23230 [Duganella sp. FT3S]|uniref:GPI inositol-deacylase PGAP1-like alpha/beta domain-containing protein n=1 Tax=Rugamonas fusca TaxID=2758568 RepID=A0A7W2ELV1_9BURK|nr:hypothetical protein [Rugamonas fusca]MBA5608266.1 hypothetical protein [Rugamonas fusca]
MDEALLPAATRRVPLSFSEHGEPRFMTVCSPKSFRVRAHAVVPPRHVIPVIFVPGIMGTNLRMKSTADSRNSAAWSPPNGTIAALGEVRKRKGQTPKNRQLQMTADRTEVDDRGKVELPAGVLTLTQDEALRRGWGALHFDSYGHVLAELERCLNDQYEEPGKKGTRKLAVWEVAQTLKKPPQIQQCAGEPDDPCWNADPVDVRRIWNAVKGNVAPLTDDEFTRLDDFFYPVWAYGYNWLDSNETAANGLVKRIDEVLAWYDKTKYFATQGKVILVTHSMGGIVARRAAQKSSNKILGVVHGVQPVSGAPVVYRRFRAGTEVGSFFNVIGAATATIIGWDAADITCVMANSPGALELLPTKNYPPGWLTVTQMGQGDVPKELTRPLPISDPYEEIYAKRVQDVWWGMVDETLIDPAGLLKKRAAILEPFESYLKILKKAKDFHDTLGLSCHPNTYATYGADRFEATFGGVHWRTDSYLKSETSKNLMSLPAKSWTMKGETRLVSGVGAVLFSLENKPSPKKDDDVDSGDGTVPNPSGASIARADGAQCVFRMKGFDHQGSYSNRDVLDNAMYCIGKIVQKAIPAREIPLKAL